MENKKSYYYSNLAASFWGYSIAEKKNGQIIIFTAALPLEDNYDWSDKKKLGDFFDDEIINEKK